MRKAASKTAKVWLQPMDHGTEDEFEFEIEDDDEWRRSRG